MNALKIKSVYFSPTGNTKKVVEAVANGMLPDSYSALDVTVKTLRDKIMTVFEELVSYPDDLPDYWIIGSPVHSGKLPKIMMQLLQRIKGFNRPAIAILTYGNKSYGIAPKQITRILTLQQFNVIAIGTFPGEHSFSGMFHVAENRPDKKDMDKAGKFGWVISQGICQIVPGENMLKGKVDVIARIMPKGGPKPFLNLERCCHCRICVNSCPLGIIDEYTKTYHDKQSKSFCLGCMACVKRCPQEARSYQLPSPVRYLFNNYYFKNAQIYRKEPEISYKSLK